MQMNVMLYGLPPGVEYGGDADLPTQIPLGKFLQHPVDCLKQQVVDRLGIDIGQVIDQVIHREDHLKMRHRNQAHCLFR